MEGPQCKLEKNQVSDQNIKELQVPSKMLVTFASLKLKAK